MGKKGENATSPIGEAVINASISAANEGLVELKELIDKATTTETDMKSFIKKYKLPLILDHVELIHHKRVDTIIPDYFLKRVDNGFDVVEIKGPNNHIFDKRTSDMTFTKFFIKGVLQIMKYIDYCDNHHDYMLSSRNMNIYKPDGILIIDKYLNDNEKTTLKMFQSFLNRISIKTYDEIYEKMKNALRSIGGYEGGE